MTAPATRRATYEDVLNAPEHMIAEILFGTLYTQACPAIPHALACTRLSAILGNQFDTDVEGPNSWFLLNKPELHLGSEPDIIVPDLAGWRGARAQQVPAEGPWIGVPPDWACEIISPSTQARDRGVKLDIYLREQVRHVWLVDPIAETLEVYRHGGAHWIRCALYASNAAVHAEPFESFELQLAKIWRRPPTTTP
ncbi:MAG: Uma2 family endonuclease [Nannocystis sp.]|uniref:Uma2 family endonuclease n=1 Tax=Nannocystis sp. TaxID=1962667 RepID=UPI002423CE21|nr:Uma2 family endonuclease [Nannocystis sp.]MBK9753189.1 Uma2 family endonuclease [Nannocystis sp.]